MACFCGIRQHRHLWENNVLFLQTLRDGGNEAFALEPDAREQSGLVPVVSGVRYSPKFLWLCPFDLGRQL